MTNAWRPVADGFTYKQPSYPVTSLTFHNNSLVISDRSAKQIVLPIDLRLCERVEDAPITPDDEANSDRYYRGFNDGVEFAQKRVEVDDEISPERLQAAGWNKSYNAEKGWFLNVHPRHIIHIDFAAEAIGEFAWVTVDEAQNDVWRKIDIPNCKTMSQLGALVKMLTRAE